MTEHEDHDIEPAIEQALRALEHADVPSDFSAAVLRRIRRDRWRTEQFVDWTFNVAVAAGLLLVAAGLAGIAWTTGVAAIGGDLVALMAAGTDELAARATRISPTFIVAATLFAVTIGLWWWSENDLPI